MEHSSKPKSNKSTVYVIGKDAQWSYEVDVPVIAEWVYKADDQTEAVPMGKVEDMFDVTMCRDGEECTCGE